MDDALLNLEWVLRGSCYVYRSVNAMQRMTTNMYYSVKSLVGDLMLLCKTAVPVPNPKTEFRADIQVHAAEHAALLAACHTWK